MKAPERVGNSPFFGAAVAVLFGVFLQVANVFALQDPAGALRVGEDSYAREVIESDLGEIPLTSGTGHDGQYAYVTARDPLAIDEEWNTSYARYRHRRVGYPFVSGLGGLLPPSGTLAGLLIVPVLSLGVVAAAAAMLVPSRRRHLALAVVIAGPGLWLSITLATPDAMALALGVAALAALRSGRWSLAVVLLAGAGLTKETHLVFAVAAAGWFALQRNWRWAGVSLGVPGSVYVAWTGWLAAHTQSGGVGLWNLDWPGVGLVQASTGWTGLSRALAVVAILSLVAAIAGVLWSPSTLAKLTLAPWILVALAGSEVVWRDGNNAVRVMAPLLVLGSLALLMTRDRTAAEPMARRVTHALS